MNGINMDIIKRKKGRFLSSEEALKDVEPIDWDKKVLEGQTKVVAAADKRRPAEWDAK